ncbi:MAG: threonylcarbamoyl-AMP synthase [Gammaproteobacteria bacterium]|nr:threonylcarbamoyl-AMP synthase [Gammaproteobacteria bacterium]
MSQYFEIHATHPQTRLIRRAVDIIEQGGVIAYPTDSGYALGYHLGDKNALERVCRIREVDKNHNFTLMCRDLSEIATYAKVENSDYRLLKAHTPGPYTFILNATREVPKRLQHAKKKTVGIRVPDHAVALALLETLGQPLMSSSLILPGEELPMADPELIREQLATQLDLIIDGGHCITTPTTVLDLTGETPEVIRVGTGDVSWLS